MLFENIEIPLLRRLEAGLEEDIKFWLPYINVKDISVTEEADLNRMNVSLTFSVGESGANQIIILNVDEQAGVSIA